MSNTQNANSQNISVLKFIDIAAIITLFSAIFYTAGWFFAYYYFERFHVGLLTLEIPVQYYFVYSFLVFKAHIFWMALFYVLFFIVVYLKKYFQLFRQRQRIFSFIVHISFPIFILLLFVGSYQFGKNTAYKTFTQQKTNDYPAYPRVKVWLKDFQQNMQAVGKPSDLQEGCYRLLLQNKEKLFLFYSLKDNTSAELPLLIIPVGEIETIKILPHYNSCGGS